jgi:hypothetical protein
MYIIKLEDYKNFLSNIDVNQYDLSESNFYLDRIKTRRLLLICNEHSEVSTIVKKLADDYPEYEFLLTCRSDIRKSNVTYINDLCKNDIDIPASIFYLSKYAQIIVGSNSSFFYHGFNKSNLSRRDHIFIHYGDIDLETVVKENQYSTTFFWSKGYNYSDLESHILKHIQPISVITWLPDMNRKIKYKFKNHNTIKRIFSIGCEDILALSLTRKKSQEHTYLEILGNHPSYTNNTYTLSKTFNWRGVSLEINKSLKTEWNYYRPDDTVLYIDPFLINYEELFQQYYKNKSIDYLCFTLDSNFYVHELLKMIFQQNIEFGLITFLTVHETNRTITDEVRNLLINAGYIPIVKDVNLPWITGDLRPVEDWWVNLKLVDAEVALDIKSRGKDSKHPIHLLFN